MHRVAAVVLLVLVLPPASHGTVAAEPPVIAVQRFLAAVKGRDCERAWTYFSAASRAYIECKSKELTASTPSAAPAFSAHNLYCMPTAAHRYHGYQPNTARLKSLSRDRAIVGIERHDPDGFRLPGFFPTRSTVTVVEIELTDEGGRWAIDVPASATGPQRVCTAPTSSPR